MKRLNYFFNAAASHLKPINIFKIDGAAISCN
jgi:hypothetical protein